MADLPDDTRPEPADLLAGLLADTRDRTERADVLGALDGIDEAMTANYRLTGHAVTTTYVAGFLIDIDARAVAVVRKGKPWWQAGRLNAIGGKIEPGETAAQAMRREFNEEAGLDVDSWRHYATVEGEWGSVSFFRAWGDVSLTRTMEEEPIEVHGLDDFPYTEALPNLSWLLPLALYSHDVYAPVVARECGAA